MYRKWKIQTEAIGTPRVRKKMITFCQVFNFCIAFFKGILNCLFIKERCMVYRIFSLKLLHLSMVGVCHRQRIRLHRRQLFDELKHQLLSFYFFIFHLPDSWYLLCFHLQCETEKGRSTRIFAVEMSYMITLKVYFDI